MWKIFFIISFIIIINISCGKVNDVIISDSHFIINSSVKEFACKPYLQRKKNSASIRLKLLKEWRPTPPWDIIVLNNDIQVKITVILYSKNGAKFKSKILGSANDMLDIRFEPEIPKTSLIKKIHITSSIPLSCNKLIWHDYNAK